jgi:hypothetical protein
MVKVWTDGPCCQEEGGGLAILDEKWFGKAIYKIYSKKTDLCYHLRQKLTKFINYFSFLTL